MYQRRKKIVAGSTNGRRLRTSSWNSGDRSIASQSIVDRLGRGLPGVSVISPPSSTGDCRNAGCDCAGYPASSA